jgi:uncharacterized membrane protein
MSRWQIRFSLAMLLLLVVTAAVLLATAAMPLVSGEDDGASGARVLWCGSDAEETALLRIVLGAAVGLGTGVWYGLRHRRRVRGLAIGIPVATLVGAAAAVYLAHGSCLPMAVVGSLLLVAVALLVRWFSIRPPADE